MDGGEVIAWRAKLAEQGIEIISEVRPEQGGISLYFHDPDGHVIELATPSIWNL
jgi:catechol 2,3-dioxygenase-like lactoylglutathione lyase family enzyme